MGKTRGGESALSPYLGRAAGALAGLAGGFYGLAAGLLIGSMVDEARAGSRLSAYLRDPAAPPPPEARAGLCAAAALALGGSWEGPAEGRRALFLRLAEKRLGLEAAELASLSRLLRALGAEAELPLELLARRLSLEGEPAVRALLGDFAYALLRLGGLPLEPGRELRLRSSLADAGLGGAELAALRAFHFPRYRDPWELLGLAPGAGQEERRRAFRRLSKLHHPDAKAPGEGGGESERFRELREAYEFLSSLPPG